MQGQLLNTRCVTKDKNQSKILYAKWKYSTGNSIKISLRMMVQLNGFSLSLSLFFFCISPQISSPPWSRCFLALYKLARIHLDFTFGVLKSYFLDTYPIKTLLEGFYNKIWVVKDTVYSHFSINAESMATLSFLFLLFLV